MVILQRAQLNQNDVKGLIWPSVRVWGTIMIFPAKEAGFEAWKHPFKANSYHKTLNGFKNNIYTYGSYFFFIGGNSIFWKAHFVGPGEWVKLRLSQALTRGARPDSNSRSAVQISSFLSSRYASWGLFFLEMDTSYMEIIYRVKFIDLRSVFKMEGSYYKLTLY